eukprot:COSAG01_NODE_5837_length_4003_cov_332.200390_4_plen_82_part_00
MGSRPFKRQRTNLPTHRLHEPLFDRTQRWNSFDSQAHKLVHDSPLAEKSMRWRRQNKDVNLLDTPVDHLFVKRGLCCATRA